MEKFVEFLNFIPKNLKGMEPLLPENLYHIYNHSIGSENLFKEDRNFDFFLTKYKKYIVPVADTFAYCLMPNHFHLVIKIKDGFSIKFNSKEIQSEFNKLKTYPGRDEFISRYVSKQFSNLFSSYTQAFNKEYSRRGSLFLKNFRRKLLDGEIYFLKLINYVHFNPVVHGFVDKPEDWKYSSYNSILSSKSTLVSRDEVLIWFNGVKNFLANHQGPMEI